MLLKKIKYQARHFLIVGAFLLLGGLTNVGAKGNRGNDRELWLEAMNQICRPVLQAASEERLTAEMPVESNDWIDRRKECTYLEALGRTLTGIAAWLELGPEAGKEGKLREELTRMAVQALTHAVDPASPDCMNFDRGRQPLVDAAFLAQALLRAPQQLWGGLDTLTQHRLLDRLAATRIITPGQNNWLLFSATIEVALHRFGGEWQPERIKQALQAFTIWYKGDGWYGDGELLHIDYYNSYVIHPMLLTAAEALAAAGDKEAETFAEVERVRFGRYAAQLERLIAPDATYPLLGRSSAYRFGAFHALSDAACRHLLPENLSPAQVRTALTAVISKQIAAKGTFDTKGWLQIGFAGHQQGLGESYISTGSLYLCSAVFVALGLPASDPFWKDPPQPWSQQHIWRGDDLKPDKSIRN